MFNLAAYTGSQKNNWLYGALMRISRIRFVPSTAAPFSGCMSRRMLENARIGLFLPLAKSGARPTIVFMTDVGTATTMAWLICKPSLSHRPRRPNHGHHSTGSRLFRRRRRALSEGPRVSLLAPSRTVFFSVSTSGVRHLAQSHHRQTKEGSTSSSPTRLITPSLPD